MPDREHQESPIKLLPRPSPIGAGWYAFGLVVNLAVLSGIVWLSYRPQDDPLDELVTLIALDGSREVAMLFIPPAPATGAGDADLGESAEVRELRRALAPITSGRVEFVTPPSEVPDRVAPAIPDSGIVAAAIGTRRRLGPAFGDGTVWRAAPLTTEEKVDISLRMAQLDPEVRERLVALIGEIPPDSFAYALNQTWVKEINGQKWGIDEQWIHLGGIKLPAMLLGLLPIPQGNVLASRDATKYEAIRQEIIENARRQEDLEDIKANIKELRERKDAERKALRERVARRDSVVAKRDSIIP